MMFVRDARLNLDALLPVLDGDVSLPGLDNFVAERQRTFLGLRGYSRDGRKRKIEGRRDTMRQI